MQSYMETLTSLSTCLARRLHTFSYFFLVSAEERKRGRAHLRSTIIAQGSLNVVGRPALNRPQ